MTRCTISAYTMNKSWERGLGSLNRDEDVATGASSAMRGAPTTVEPPSATSRLRPDSLLLFSFPDVTVPAGGVFLR